MQCLHSAWGAVGIGAAWVYLLSSNHTTGTRYHRPMGDISQDLWAILMGGPLSKQGEIIAHNADGQRGAEWQEQGRHRDHSAGLGARGWAGDKCCACLSSQHCSTSRSNALQSTEGLGIKATAQPAVMGCKNRCLCFGNSTDDHHLSLNTAQAHPSPQQSSPKHPYVPIFLASCSLPSQSRPLPAVTLQHLPGLGSPHLPPVWDRQPDWHHRL